VSAPATFHFEAYPRGPRTSCLRFAVALAVPTTQDSLPAAVLDPTGAGLSPADRFERFLHATCGPPLPGFLAQQADDPRPASL